jgi:NADH-quinone oxidoreductase subunit M
MILALLILILIAGAIVTPIASKINKALPKIIALAVLAIEAIIILGSWNLSSFPTLFKNSAGWMLEFKMNWIPAMGISVHFAIDGLSYLMILLTIIMGFISVLASPKTENEGFYYFNTLLMISGVVGIFLSVDLFLFFFFWEMMLLPLYLLMVMFGKSKSQKTSLKFFIYTQFSGLILLISILSLYFIHYKETGIYSFDYADLMNVSLPLKTASLLMLGFLVAFLVKLPVVPFHGWLPASFTEAPITAVVTGLMIKTGAYGIIRFAIPMFHESSKYFASTALVIGVITILYGAFMAYAKEDLREIAAYSGISHMGFILLGIYAFNSIGWQGVVIQMIASAVSTSALVIIAASLLKRTGTCNINQLGGIWEKVPVLSGIGTFIAMASLGLPGTGNFIAEFLILTGTFKVSIVITVLASLGLVAAAAYSLRIIQKIFVGNKNKEYAISDFSWIEKVSLGALIVIIVWIGLQPQPILNRSKAAVEKILNMEILQRDVPVKTNVNEESVKLIEP